MSAPLGPGAPDENDESTQATPASADPLQLSGPELEPEEMAALAAFAAPAKLRAAVDQAFVPLDAPIANAKEVAIFPPVTGG